MKPVRVGICGLGTVGGGTFNVLTRNADEIARRAGRPIVIEQVAYRSPNPECDITGIKTTQDVFELAPIPISTWSSSLSAGMTWPGSWC